MIKIAAMVIVFAISAIVIVYAIIMGAAFGETADTRIDKPKIHPCALVRIAPGCRCLSHPDDPDKMLIVCEDE